MAGWTRSASSRQRPQTASRPQWKEASRDNLQHDAKVRGRRTEAESGVDDLRHRLAGGPAQPVRHGHGAGVLARLVLHGDWRGTAAGVGAESPRAATEEAPGRTKGA